MHQDDVCPACHAPFSDTSTGCSHCALLPQKQAAAEKERPTLTWGLVVGILVSCSGLALSILMSDATTVVLFYGMIVGGVAIAYKY